MTHSELDKWRKIVPYAIFGFCLLLWFLVSSKSFAATRLADDIIVPALALIASFFYVGLGLRGPLWKREIDTHVGNQIRETVLEMLPKDLEVTENEKEELLKREIFGQLTGVFWEAVDNNDVLRSQKEHFYSNGIVYSTSIDVFLICGFIGLVYGGASLVLWKAKLAYVGALLVVIALASRVFVTPHRRKVHLDLSAEQLRLLRRQHSDFIADRFRQIVAGWRRNRLLGQPSQHDT